MSRTGRRVLAVLLAAAVAAGTAACGQPGGQRAGDGVQDAGETQTYTMSEGDVVYVDPSTPLPANVRDDIAFMNQAVVDADLGPDRPAEPAVAGDPNRTVVSTIAHQAAWATAATGREIIVVYRLWGTPGVGGSPGVDGSPDVPQWLWAATGRSFQAAIPDKAARVAEVTAYVAASDDPGAWEIVVLD